MITTHLRMMDEHNRLIANIECDTYHEARHLLDEIEASIRCHYHGGGPAVVTVGRRSPWRVDVRLVARIDIETDDAAGYHSWPSRARSFEVHAEVLR